MIDNPVIQGVVGGGGGGMVLIALGYRVLRVLRGDQRKDRVDEAADALRSEMGVLIKELKTEIKELDERCDSFAKERNEAVALAGELRATVDGLRSRLEDVIQDRQRLIIEMTGLRERNDILVADNIRLQAGVKTMTEMMTKLTGMPPYDWTNVVKTLPETGA